MKKEDLACYILIIIFIFYMTWQLGRWYGKNEGLKQVKTDNTMLIDYCIKTCDFDPNK